MVKGMTLLAVGAFFAVFNEAIAMVLDEYYKTVWGCKRRKATTTRVTMVLIGVALVWEGVRALIRTR